MNQFFLIVFKKLFFKQWVIGLSKGDIKEIIRSKKFDPEIKWLPLDSSGHFHADPFPIRNKDGKLIIFFEDFSFDDFYGKISLMTIDKNFNQVYQKELLDTKSHLSYPFIFFENNKIFMFPEAAHSGKLTCYEYDIDNKSLKFQKEILNLPLLDSTILKYNGKYWLFGTLIGKDSDRKLNLYYSDNLMGPYVPHRENPIKSSLNGSRPAGNFIEVDGVLYRPSQNCENQYGESITINKVITLNETNYAEEPYMLVCINKKRNTNDEIFTIHTINVIDDMIIVDGLRCTFSPKNQWKNFLRNRAYAKRRKITKEKRFIQTDKF